MKKISKYVAISLSTIILSSCVGGESGTDDSSLIPDINSLLELSSNISYLRANNSTKIAITNYSENSNSSDFSLTNYDSSLIDVKFLSNRLIEITSLGEIGDTTIDIVPKSSSLPTLQHIVNITSESTSYTNNPPTVSTKNDSYTMSENSTLRLNPTIYDANGDNVYINAYSLQPSIATVSYLNGDIKINALANGVANIAIMSNDMIDNGVDKYISVNVIESTDSTDYIELDCSNLSNQLKIGDSVDIPMTSISSSGTTFDYTISIDDTSLASYSEDNYKSIITLNALSGGETNIVVTPSNGDSKSCKIDIEPAQEPTLSVDCSGLNSSIYVGESVDIPLQHLGVEDNSIEFTATVVNSEVATATSSANRSYITLEAKKDGETNLEVTVNNEIIKSCPFRVNNIPISITCPSLSSNFYLNDSVDIPISYSGLDPSSVEIDAVVLNNSVATASISENKSYITLKATSVDSSKLEIIANNQIIKSCPFTVKNIPVSVNCSSISSNLYLNDSVNIPVSYSGLDSSSVNLSAIVVNSSVATASVSENKSYITLNTTAVDSSTLEIISNGEIVQSCPFTVEPIPVTVDCTPLNSKIAIDNYVNLEVSHSSDDISSIDYSVSTIDTDVAEAEVSENKSYIVVTAKSAGSTILEVVSNDKIVKSCNVNTYNINDTTDTGNNTTNDTNNDTTNNDTTNDNNTSTDGLAFSDTDSETLTNFQTMCSNMSPDFKIGEGYSPKKDDYYGNDGNGLKFASARDKYDENGIEIDSSMTLFYPILSDEDIAKLTFAESDLMGDINRTSFIPPNDDKEVKFYIYFESLYYGKKFYTAYEIQGDFGNTYSCEEWTFIQTNFEPENTTTQEDNNDDIGEPTSPTQ